jgi:hypothetical protein
VRGLTFSGTASLLGILALLSTGCSCGETGSDAPPPGTGGGAGDSGSGGVAIGIAGRGGWTGATGAGGADAGSAGATPQGGPESTGGVAGAVPPRTGGQAGTGGAQGGASTAGKRSADGGGGSGESAGGTETGGTQIIGGDGATAGQGGGVAPPGGGSSGSSVMETDGGATAVGGAAGHAGAGRTAGAAGTAGTAGAAGNAREPCPASPSTGFLADVMDQFHDRLNVYRDKDSPGNHFAARGLMGDPVTVPPMNEGHHTYCASTADSCIEATYQPEGQGWGGWYFLNGVLTGTDRGPSLNWGDAANAGLDLRGATRLHFRARGAIGGERVEFFALGVGRDAATGTPTNPYPDSSVKVTNGFVTLTSAWTDYEIDLTGCDLSYVLGGFAWVTSSVENENRSITFYLDDIYYDKPALDEPRFLVSYLTDLGDPLEFDSVMRNVAFTYDNAVALIHFLSVGDTRRARLIADALVYAQTGNSALGRSDE